MNMGGDDYLQKPFSLEVLMAKMNALCAEPILIQIPRPAPLNITA